jgi:hypothetical protein
LRAGGSPVAGRRHVGRRAGTERRHRHPLSAPYSDEPRSPKWKRRILKGTEQTLPEQLDESQDVLRWALKKKGPTDPFSIKAMDDVANQLAALDRQAEEAPLRLQVVGALRDSLGDDHESTLNAELKLARCLIVLGRAEDAEPLLAHVVAGRTEALGSDDPETLVALAWSASVANRLGRGAQARMLQEQVVAGYTSAGLDDDPRALSATRNLASTLTELGLYNEAATHMRHVLEAGSLAVGADHPKTLDDLEVLTAIVLASGEPAEAAVLAASLVDACERVFGPGADATGRARTLLARSSADS